MPFSHHSHSGQFCHHATNTLDEMVREAIARKMTVYCLTEHMPRGPEDLYPEELAMGKEQLSHASPKQTSHYLFQMFEDYYHEALRLREKYADRITILIGMEIDWISPSSETFIQNLLEKYPMDLFVGSVHHVRSIPIDYSADMFQEAVRECKGTEEKLFEEYFDLQYEMLRALKPPIVGHFDLIRLKSQCPNESVQRYSDAWEKALRNISFVIEYGGIFEINSAALRKGLTEPYPKADLCDEIASRKGRFVLSDDAHGVDQVGTNYPKVMEFCQQVGIASVTAFQRGTMGVTLQSVSVTELWKHPFFLDKSCV